VRGVDPIRGEDPRVVGELVGCEIGVLAGESSVGREERGGVELHVEEGEIDGDRAVGYFPIAVEPAWWGRGPVRGGGVVESWGKAGVDFGVVGMVAG